MRKVFIGPAGSPFVFVTGYGDTRILERFSDIDRIRKPMIVRRGLRAAALMCQPATG